MAVATRAQMAGLVARLAFPCNDFRVWQRIVKVVGN
jgi:hypothetical protein